MSVSENQNPDGTFKAGNNANPEGNNGHLAGWQRYGDRIQKWFELPAEELAKYVADGGVLLNKMSAIDNACIKHVINTYSGDKTLAYLKEALDRIEGTPKQTIAHATDKDNPVIFTLNFGTGPAKSGA
jgi:hypothetical protein